MENELNSFLQSLLSDNGYSPLTIKNYHKSIKKFLNFSKVKKASDIDSEILIKYRNFISSENKSYLTKNLYLAPMRSFFSYLNRKGANINYRDYISGFRNKNSNKELLLPNRQQLELFLTPQGSPLMDVFVRLLYATGLRIAEALSLQVGQAQEKFTIQGKGGKLRLIMCDQTTISMIRDWESSLSHPSGKLFDITARSIERKFKKRSKALGLNITPHTLRHCFATTMLDVGTDIRVVQELMGHSSISTTQRYTHISDNMLQVAHLKHPFNT